jgi:hypothetical protein
MTILRRGNSKFWYVQFQIGGKTIIRSSRSTSRKVAEQLEAQLRTQAHARIFLGHKPSLSLADALNRFAAAKSGTPNHRNVLGHIRTILRVIPGPTLLERLSSDQIEAYCQARRDAADRLSGVETQPECPQWRAETCPPPGASGRRGRISGGQIVSWSPPLSVP